MRIGTLALPTNLFLSPLAGYTNLPFRLVLREIGGVALCTTDLVNARSLLEKNKNAFKLIETRPADAPLAVQLFGSVPEEMRDAAQILESLGCAAVDVNMGCPVRKVCSVGGGSAMMTGLAKTAALVQGMVQAVKIPVTAKMRLGWDDQNLTAPDLARALEDAGIAAVFVHGRTRQQGFGGTVNLAGIRAVVRAVKQVPVIGNGDVITPAAAKKMLDETGCAGVSIGRGAFYNPWIFQQTLDYLQTFRSSGRQSAQTANDASRSSGRQSAQTANDASRSSGRQSAQTANDLEGNNEPTHVGGYKRDANLPPEPVFGERIRVMCRHLDLMIEVFGEGRGCRMFRKVAPWYARRFGPCHEFNKRVVQVSTRADFHAVLEHYFRWRRQFLDEHGELQLRFRPPPLVASFMRDPVAAPGGQLPVPKGPSENW
jgi:nifR3 family TIM-barrel protein